MIETCKELDKIVTDWGHCGTNFFYFILEIMGTSAMMNSFKKCGGDMASTWALKHKEHTGEHEDLVKTCTL